MPVPTQRAARDPIRGDTYPNADGQIPKCAIPRDDRAALRLPIQEPAPVWIRAAGLLAMAGGLGHDLGKSGRIFADKLALAVDGKHTSPDGVRHEWLSMRLLQALRSGIALQAAWDRVAKPEPLQRLCDPSKPWCLEQGLRTVWDALDFIVATHHRLFAPLDADGALPDCSAHVRPDAPRVTPAAILDERLIADLASIMDRLARLVGQPEPPPEFWRGLALLARAGLILADHEVSARTPTPFAQIDPYPTEPRLHANTHRSEDGKVCYNQCLGWHLDRVARVAADRTRQIARLRLPSLSGAAIGRVLTPADEAGRFAWQNRAVEAVRCLRAQSDGAPMLVFNIAATGSGKTRMNAKLVCALRERPRFAIALNLRTLTLQTGDALREMGIGTDESATIIGDRTAAALHEWSRTAFDVQNEEALESVEYDALGAEGALPAWMQERLDKHPAWRRILGVPVLISTIDFLIHAGEPGRQGHHVAALLRLADSDLILDEIDGYDPKALVAVLRLIQMTAFMGRHLICSSATLATPIAEAVRRAFLSGLAMRAALEGRERRASMLIIDDWVEPTQVECHEDFGACYVEHVRRLGANQPPVIYRRPRLQPVRARSEPAWREAVLEAVAGLHADQAWPCGRTGRSVSFGLVRVANIRTAIPLARYLAERLPQARVACYHSQDLLIQRHAKEQRLDRLLSRKQGNATIEHDPEINRILEHSTTDSIHFIVVATPVEEVGRDHDFDWAVLEPSSTHSLVQAGGRVNRHRLHPVERPNIAILQYNARWARGETFVFCRPGLESREHPYPEHDLATLLDWERLESLDARLRFDGCHAFARYDDHLLAACLREPLRVLEADSAYPSTWMTEGFYRSYPLRDDEPTEHWRMVVDADGRGAHFEQAVVANYRPTWKRREISRLQERLPNDWLVDSPVELLEACRRAGIEADKGLVLSVRRWCPDEPLSQDPSFGFW